MEKSVSSLLENLIKKQKGEKLQNIVECHLYTDAFVKGQIISENGLYEILNTCVLSEENIVLPRLIFRYQDYRPEFSFPKCPLELSDEKVEIDSFLEGNIGEQIAVLISLILGIRIKSSAPNRFYKPNCSSELGDAKYYLVQDDPKPIRFSSGKMILPNAIRKNISISQCKQYLNSLDGFTDEGKFFNALLRSAKLYRDALWIVELETSLSWLMFVSAIETAAQFEFSSPDREQTSFKLLSDLDSKLAGSIENSCNNGDIEIIAKRIIDKKYATKKFLKFMEKYFPPPPEDRPAEAFQFDWSWESLGDSLKKIYVFRSEALHGGKVFPEEMCKPAQRHENQLFEKPLPPCRTDKNKIHEVKNAPVMYLHVFEYIVRASLLNWWNNFSR